MLSIALFELRTRLHRISTYVYFLAFLAFGGFLVVAATGAIKGAVVAFGGGKVLANAPYALHEYLALTSYFGVVVTAVIMGRAVQQDFEHEVHPFFFTAPITKLQYLGGRFLGALLTLLFISSGIALGAAIATKLPWAMPERLGPNVLRAYVQPYLTIILPNLVFIGAIFFGLAALTRKMFGVYVTAVVLFIGWMIASNLVGELDYRTAVALIDPFGTFATDELTRYWTIAEKNTRAVPFAGMLVWNRLLWTAIAAGLFAFCYARFQLIHAPPVGRALKKKIVDPDALAPPSQSFRPPRAQPTFPALGSLLLVPRLAWLAFRETVKNVYFAAIVLCGVLLLFSVATTVIGQMFGTTVYPVTYAVLDISNGIFTLFVLITITVYSGELVWREREAKLDQIHDALPVPTWLPHVSKLIALVMVQVLLLVVVLACGVLVQAFKGYFRFEIGLYLHELFGIRLVDYALLCVLAFAVHALVNNKYVGHVVMILYYVSRAVAAQVGFEHNLYRFGGRPQITYSDMNGYGHFLAGVRWFELYWALFAVALALLAHAAWVRGTESGLKVRLKIARGRATRPVLVTAAAVLAAFAGVGTFIFHNTNRLNHYWTKLEKDELKASYEKKYKALEKDPQPRVISSRSEVDLYPSERRARIRGTLGLENKTDQPVKTLHVLVDGEAVIHRLEPGAKHTLGRKDELIGLHDFDLAEPLAPGAKLPLELDLEYVNPGFTNDRGDIGLVYNGTFINSVRFPHIGYGRGGELEEDNTRKEHGLSPRERMPELGDPEGLKNNYITSDADWIDFETTVSTSADQLALAPGYLQKEWTDGGRRYFHYKMDAPILNFYSFLSGRWEVKRDVWNDVAIEVYYHPTHTYNLDRMIEGVKATLEYCSRELAPYQHRQVRIIEFPRYQTFAQSFPNTIPYSESVGFIAKVDANDEKDVDYPYYVTAHEVAHQWWAHQVIGADMQGSTLMSESLAQYSALMVMKQKYGAERMGRFLRYELDRYLMGRSTEKMKELPLERVENQGYIHYNKGSLVMYLLQDVIGERQLNQILRRFLERTAYKGPPYPTSKDLIDELRAAVPEESQYLIKDLFEQITLYENHAKEALVRKRDDGKYEIVLTAFARKVKSDELGKEEEVPMADFVELGALDKEGKPVVIEREKIGSGELTVTLVADREPVKAGIDPLFKLIDRQPDDNLVRVESQ